MARSTASPTQEHLPIAGIVDGVVIMTDGSLRAVLKVEPINFDLKSETEQNAIIYAYQSFLNSLDFPIQIVIQSKKLDLEQYLIKLDKYQKTVANDLLRIQIEDYVGFVRRLISVANIMSKRFYIVVSYSPVSGSAGLAQISNIFHRQPTGPLMDEAEFERYRAETHNRANIIAGGIGRLGVKSQLLETQQLIELFYGVYNPDVVSEERLTDVGMLSAGIVSALDSPDGPKTDVPLATAPVAQLAPPQPAPSAPQALSATNLLEEPEAEELSLQTASQAPAATPLVAPMPPPGQSAVQYIQAPAANPYVLQPPPAPQAPPPPASPPNPPAA